MKSLKKASEIVPGDKVFTTEKPNMPSVVKASYQLGEHWALEVEGIQMILQSKPDDKISVWGN